MGGDKQLPEFEFYLFTARRAYKLTLFDILFLEICDFFAMAVSPLTPASFIMLSISFKVKGFPCSSNPLVRPLRRRYTDGCGGACKRIRNRLQSMFAGRFFMSHDICIATRFKTRDYTHNH